MDRYFMHYVDSALDPAAEDRLAAWPASEPQTASVLRLRTGFHSVATWRSTMRLNRVVPVSV
jgi:hypothetical protein